MPNRLVRAVGGEKLLTYFQPIVSLPERRIVGYEALSRWPRIGTPQVFAHARAHDCLNSLERLCIENAVTAADDARLTPGALLCVNTEPTTVYLDRRSSPILDSGADRFHIMFELTERDLLASPAKLLHKVDGLRADGFAIAIDDVDAHRAATAVFDVICPDVIKLDLELVQHDPTIDQSRTLAAVLAYRERSGATILAEGIENEEHLEQALALGAALGQGYFFGHPSIGPPATMPDAWHPPVAPTGRTGPTGTAFELVEHTDSVRVARKELLLAFSRSIERHVENAADNQIVLACLQDSRFFTGRTRQTYVELAASCPLAAVFGRGLESVPGSELRAVDLAQDDPLTREWIVVAIGGHSASALIARECGDPSAAEPDRRFDFLITQDRSIVARAARNLLSRIP